MGKSRSILPRQKNTLVQTTEIHIWRYQVFVYDNYLLLIIKMSGKIETSTITLKLHFRQTLHKKWSFSLRISPANVTKWKTSFFVQWNMTNYYFDVDFEKVDVQVYPWVYNIFENCSLKWSQSLCYRIPARLWRHSVQVTLVNNIKILFVNLTFQ